SDLHIEHCDGRAATLARVACACLKRPNRSLDEAYASLCNPSLRVAFATKGIRSFRDEGDDGHGWSERRTRAASAGECPARRNRRASRDTRNVATLFVGRLSLKSNYVDVPSKRRARTCVESRTSAPNAAIDATSLATGAAVHRNAGCLCASRYDQRSGGQFVHERRTSAFQNRRWSSVVRILLGLFIHASAVGMACG